MVSSSFVCVASSVKHKYDGNWDNKNIKLTTCNPNDKESTKQRDPQELVADEELIFSYDIKFFVCFFPMILGS
jgi:transmembrane 9 superfamily protein 2/4